jgi:hypothetical protein
VGGNHHQLRQDAQGAGLCDARDRNQQGITLLKITIY